MTGVIFCVDWFLLLLVTTPMKRARSIPTIATIRISSRREKAFFIDESFSGWGSDGWVIISFGCFRMTEFAVDEEDGERGNYEAEDCSGYGGRFFEDGAKNTLIEEVKRVEDEDDDSEGFEGFVFHETSTSSGSGSSAFVREDFSFIDFATAWQSSSNWKAAMRRSSFPILS